MTTFNDYLNKASIDEKAEILMGVAFCCNGCAGKSPESCVKCIKLWLMSECRMEDEG